MAFAVLIGLVEPASGQSVLFSQKLPQVPDLIFTAAEIEGRQVNLVIDTGCGRLVVDNSLRKLVEPAAERQTIVSVFGQKFPSTLHKGPLVKVGTITYNRPLTLNLDLRSYWTVYGRDFEAVLSAEQLGHGIFRIDHEKGVAELVSSSSYSPSDEFNVLALSSKQDVPTFDGTIDKTRISFGVDTGDNGCISIERSIFEELVSRGVIRVRSLDSQVIVGGGTAVSERQGWFEKGELMGVQLKGVPVAESGKSNLGQQWLFGFNIEFDLRNRKLYYLRRADKAVPAATNLMFGALVVYQDGIAFVASLRPGPGTGPAEAAGLKLGDVIVKLGKLEAKELNSASIATAILESAGKSLVVRVKRKGETEERSVEVLIPKVKSGWDFPGGELWGGGKDSR